MADGATYGGMTGQFQRYGMGGTSIPQPGGSGGAVQGGQMAGSQVYAGQRIPPNDPSLSRDVNGMTGRYSSYNMNQAMMPGSSVQSAGYGGAGGFGGARAINGFGAMPGRSMVGNSGMPQYRGAIDTGVRPGVAAPVQGPPQMSLQQIQAEMARRQVGAQLNQNPQNSALAGYMMGK